MRLKKVYMIYLNHTAVMDLQNTNYTNLFLYNNNESDPIIDLMLSMQNKN